MARAGVVTNSVKSICRRANRSIASQSFEAHYSSRQALIVKRKWIVLDLNQETHDQSGKMRLTRRATSIVRDRNSCRSAYKEFLPADPPQELLCIDCAVRRSGICATLDPDELRELDHLAGMSISSRARLVRPRGTGQVILQSDQGVLKLYKLLSDGPRQIVGFALPAISMEWRPPHVTAFPPTRLAPSRFASSPERPSRDLSRTNRTSCIESTSLPSAN